MKLIALGYRYYGPLAIFILVFAIKTFSFTSATAAELFAGIASNGRLVLFSSDDPSDVAVMQVRGLQAGEEILGIDMRPATGQLYALGSSNQIYVVSFDANECVFTAVGAPFAPALKGTKFGFDFNPMADRIRIVGDSGQNLRLNPMTGAVAAVDGTLNYAAGDSGEGMVPNVVAAAYTNNDNDPATGTMLFDIDVTRDTLLLQNPPNSGTLITVGLLGIDAKSVAGFDVAGSDGTAYASLVVNTGKNPQSDRAALFTIDLVTGEAIFIGEIGGPKPLNSLTALGRLP